MPNFLTPSKNPSKTALDLLLFATRKNIRREKPSIPPCRTRCTLAQLQSKLINKLWGKWTALMIYGLCVNVLNPAFVLSSIFSNISSHPCCSTFPKPDEEVDWPCSSSSRNESRETCPTLSSSLLSWSAEGIAWGFQMWFVPSNFLCIFYECKEIKWM